MAKVIPNQQTWVGFATSVADISAPTTAEIDGATDLTTFLVSLDASTRGNVLPTPSFDTTFETSVAGTVGSQFTAEFYRDETADTAWTTLDRGTSGYFIVSRFGGSGTVALPNGDTRPKPISSDTVEVWPVRITSRSALSLTNNDVQRFQIECAVTTEPAEAATVA